jgi:hypothetical protein
MYGAVLPFLAYPYISKTRGLKTLDDPGYIGRLYPGQDNPVQVAILFITGTQSCGHQTLKTLRGIPGTGKSA